MAGTTRERLAEILRQRWLGLREMSQALGLSERDVVGHLEHLERSLAARGEILERAPAACVACGFDFEARRRLAKPGRCPRCRSSRVRGARFHVAVG